MNDVKLDTHVLDRMAANLDGNTDKAVESLAFQVQAEAQHIIEVKHIIDTGALLNSIHTEKQGKSRYWVLDGVEYGIWQEIGHHTRSGSFVAARPFMVPATEKVGRDANEAFGDVLK